MAEELKPILLVSNEYDVYSDKWDKDYDERFGIQKITLDDMCNNPNIVFDKSNTISEGSMFIKHPFIDNKYIDLCNAEDIIIKDKIKVLSKVALFLGAKKISSKVISCESVKNESKLKINGEYLSIGGGYERNSEISEKYEKISELVEEYNGELTPKTYNEAKMLLKKYNMENDTDFSDLLDKRNPNSTNQMVSQSVKMAVNSEYNKIIDNALRVKGVIFNIDTEYVEKLQCRYEVVMEYTIKF